MAEGLAFKVTAAPRARRVEKWICSVKRDFLDAATTKCVGVDYEFTDPRKAGEQRAAFLQLSVASETLVFQIISTDEVPQVLKEFLQDGNIRFYTATIDNDVKKLHHYVIHITSWYDLQKVVPNPTKKPILSLYELANYTIGTNLEKKKKYNKKKMDVAAQEKEDELIFEWANFLLSYEQVHYIALDTRLGFEIDRRHWNLVGYNSHVDRLNI
ncbi:uncharacterized protein [Lolium perenne]|uniref:uncharacterized protein n=1 Tax=Lolium perenne TaxID=4522 RepID=UPI0021F59DCD|nr:uncharacterized protein LOC127315002 [Lolium perenne]